MAQGQFLADQRCLPNQSLKSQSILLFTQLGARISDGFMPFQRALAQHEMQIGWMADSISYVTITVTLSTPLFPVSGSLQKYMPYEQLNLPKKGVSFYIR